MNKPEEIIMFDSNEAANLQTGLSGWVSRLGRFFGNDERAARYDGCTHVKCEDCGKPSEKGWLVCPDCRDKRDIVRYNAMPKEEWDGTGMLYSDSHNRYFSDWDEIDEYCEEEGVTKESLRLIICIPQHLHLINSDDWCDELAEDGELPDVVMQAVDALNEAIIKAGAVSWFPSTKAVKLEE